MDKFFIVILVIIVVLVGAGFYVFNKPVKINNQNQNMQNTQPEVKIEILKEGTGEAVKTGDKVLVNYTGMLLDGTKFDSNIDPAFKHVTPFPVTVGIGEVIKGWDLGIVGMKVGEKRKLIIPAELAYGNRQIGSLIPANSSLIFEIDLLQINPQ